MRGVDLERLGDRLDGAEGPIEHGCREGVSDRLAATERFALDDLDDVGVGGDEVQAAGDQLADRVRRFLAGGSLGGRAQRFARAGDDAGVERGRLSDAVQ